MEIKKLNEKIALFKDDKKKGTLGKGKKELRELRRYCRNLQKEKEILVSQGVEYSLKLHRLEEVYLAFQ